MKNISFAIIAAIALVVSSCGETPSDEVQDTTLQVKDSLTYLNELIRDDPNNLDLYYRRAMWYVNTKDFGSAVMDIERVLKVDSSNVKYVMGAADIYFFMNRISRAEQLFKRAVELEPKNIDCMLKLATLHHYMKRYDEEVELLDKVIDQDKRNSQAFFMRGMVAKEKGDSASAMKNMQLAVQMDPDYYNAYIQMGVIAASQGNPLAVDYYRNALEIQPMSIEALYNLGMYYQGTEQYEMAINTYSAILQLDPMHFDSHFNKGVIYTEYVDSLDKGLENFDLAIRDNPGDPRGYFGRGKVNEKLGRIDAASADYKKALEVDPQHTGAAKALSELSTGAN